MADLRTLAQILSDRTRVLVEGEEVPKWWMPDQHQNICKTCYAPCCSSQMTVALYPSDPIYLYRNALVPTAAIFGGCAVQGITLAKRDHQCVYRINGGCSIYKNRPASCRTFFCGRGEAICPTWRIFQDYKGGRKAVCEREELILRNRLQTQRRREARSEQLQRERDNLNEEERVEMGEVLQAFEELVCRAE